MAHKLGIFWTVLPNSVEFTPPPPPPPPVENPDGGGGVVEGGDGPPGGGGPIIIGPSVGTRKLRFSATVAFRLARDNGSTDEISLAAFPPMRDWPSTLNDMDWEVKFNPLPGGAVYSQAVYEPTRIVTAQSEAWNALFGDSMVTPQNPQQYEARDQRIVRSFARDKVRGFVRGLHAGAEYAASADPTQVVRTPIPASVLQTKFGAIRQARQSRTSIALGLEQILSRQPSAPATWAISRAARANLGDENRRIAADFVQLAKYYRRLEEQSPSPLPASKPEVQEYDFHQLSAMALMQPAVARALGLIVDFELEIPEDHIGANGSMRLIAHYPTEGVDRTDAFYATAFRLDNELFEIFTRNPLYDADGRYLLLGTDAYDVEDGLDVDSAALKADGAEEVFSAALDADDLPALKTTGIGVNRSDNALKLGDVRRRDRQRFNAAYGVNSDAKANLSLANATAEPAFINFAEDLVRGFRFDVYDEAKQRWYSLHRRSGEYVVGRGGDAVSIELPDDGSDEGFSTIASVRPVQTSTTQPAPPDEYYLSESIMRWNGWSMSVPRVGIPIMNGDELMARGEDGKPAHERPDTSLGNVVSKIDRAHGLPRLRFGSTYRFRARVVDTAGNSAAFDRDIAPEELGDAVTEPVTFRRFDPVESPTLLYRTPPVPGETVHELVLRSDGVDDMSEGEVRRLVPPPPTSQWIAECHGAFDPSIDGDNGVAIAQYNALLRDREGLSWTDSDFVKPIPGGRPGEIYAPVVAFDNELTVPYLPDPAARGVLFQNLPGFGDDDDFYEGTGLSEKVMFASEWPNIQPVEIKMIKGDGAAGPGAFIAPTNGGRQMLINLHKGDVHTLGLSSVPDHFGDVFGLLQWAIDESLAQNPGVSREQIEDGIKRGVVDGFHRSISPIQVVKLIHAVRRPLFAPIYQTRGEAVPNSWRVFRRLGETQAFPTGGLGYSPRSTGRLDVRAIWNDYRDTGPGGVNPTIPIPRAAQVFSKELDRSKVQEGLFPDAAEESVGTSDAIQEFGDTHHYRSTYFAKATTAFLKYFRESKRLTFGTGKPVTQTFSATPLSEAPIHVVGVTSGRRYVENESYILDRAARTVSRIANVQFEIDEPVNVSFIPGVISWENAGVTIDVPSTVRPNPPLVHSIVPMFRWNRSFRPGGLLPPAVQSSRSGGGLRVWLDRPWWSSGEGEQLGVVVLPIAEAIPGDDRFYSHAGTDAATASKNTKRQLRRSDFSGNNPVADVTLAENGMLVGVVPYTVQFDVARDQWFADIEVNPSVTGAVGHFPFVKLALVRYQPYSMELGAFAPGTSIEQTVSLSSVVTTDFIQVAPQRDVTVTKPNATTLNVSVSGESYRAMQKESEPFQFPTGRGPSRVLATLQRRVPSIADPVLGWESVPNGPIPALSGYVTTELVAGGSATTAFSWSGALTIPSTGGPYQLVYEYRVLVEEFEVHYSDTDPTAAGPASPNAIQQGVYTVQHRVPSGLRCVFQDMIPLEGL